MIDKLHDFMTVVAIFKKILFDAQGPEFFT